MSDYAHEWQPFDTEKGYHVKRDDDGSYLVRDADGKITDLTVAEFKQWRDEGENPKGLR